MDNKLNKIPEGQPLSDRELDIVSGGTALGNELYHYACDKCCIWVSTRKAGNYVHKPCSSMMKQVNAEQIMNLHMQSGFNATSFSEAMET